MLRLNMLNTIELDDKTLFATQKIDDIMPKRNLADEFMSTELAVFQICPQEPFFLGVLGSQLSGELGFVGEAMRDRLS